MRIDDFTGFYWNGKHTSEMNITVVSDGSRYNGNLLSPITNNLTTLPGMDGQYFYDSNFGAKTFTINIAFDKVTEKQLREITVWLSYKDLSDLVFDERPYKAYGAKLSGTPSLKYLCFDEWVWEQVDKKYQKVKKRIYKGEGTLTFIAPIPFAHTPRDKNGKLMKYLEDYKGTYPNIDEWKDASGLKDSIKYKYGSNSLDYDQVKVIKDNPDTTNRTIAWEFRVYNGGDMPVPFKLRLPLSRGGLGLTDNDNQPVDDKGNKIANFQEMPIYLQKIPEIGSKSMSTNILEKMFLKFPDPRDENSTDGSDSLRKLLSDYKRVEYRQGEKSNSNTASTKGEALNVYLEIDSQKQSINLIKQYVTTGKEEAIPIYFTLSKGNFFKIPEKVDNLRILVYDSKYNNDSFFSQYQINDTTEETVIGDDGKPKKIEVFKTSNKDLIEYKYLYY